MDDTFTYKCPSCGGKVDYNEINHKWICEYCGNSYEALFVPKVIRTLPSIEERNFNLYSFQCDNCNQKYVSKDSSSNCPNCNTKCNGIMFKVSNIVDFNKPLAIAKAEYLRSISPVKKYLDKSYFDFTFECQYFNCDLYNGYVVLEHNDNIRKFIFVNLLIPNIEYEDYRFMYEIGNIGVDNSRVLTSNSSEEIQSKIVKFGKIINSVVDKNYEQDIVNECVKIFAKELNITAIKDIKVEKNFNVEDGTFIPLYVKKISLNGKDYRQYIVGNSNSPVNAIVEFPEEDDANNKAKKYSLLSFISSAISVISFVSIIAVFKINIDSPFLIIIFLISVILLSIFPALSHIYYEKYLYYIKTVKLTKDEYFNQIINNSNYVKILKVKK